MKSDLNASHEELRVYELELRRASADNQVLREKISEAEGLHNASSAK